MEVLSSSSFHLLSAHTASGENARKNGNFVAAAAAATNGLSACLPAHEKEASFPS